MTGKKFAKGALNEEEKQLESAVRSFCIDL
jgi:hypothetical protein